MTQTGITTLSPTDYQYNTYKDIIDIDICFVHGLNGHAFKSWTSNGPEKCFWPRDLLPMHFPEARIMTFGYNANLLADTSQGRIAEFAENLLAELSAERLGPGEKLRPIIFVCHSMGGLVVKRALTVAQSRQSHNPTSKATRAVIFMATPHRGSNKAYWAAIGQGLISLLQTDSTSAVKELEAFSTVLEDINSDFMNIASNYYFVSFYERLHTGKILVVEKWSAIMEHCNERNRIGVTANHQDICKFEGADCERFRTCFKQLRMLVREALGSEEEDAAPVVVAAKSSITNNSHLLAGPASDISESLFQMHSRKPEPNSSGEDTIECGSMLNESKNLTRPRHSLPSGNTQSDITNMIFDVPHFVVGRYFGQEYALTQVYRGLINSDNPRSFGIHGIGGVGKTQLALRYILKFRHLYSHIFWIVADSDMKLSMTYQKIALRLDLVQKDDEDPTKYRDVVKDWLLRHKTWLLVFDNVDDPCILEGYLPLSITGSMLTTSRTSTIIETKIVEDGLHLEPLSIEEGTEFLLSRIPNVDIEQKGLASEISEELGGHLLALSTMAAYITESQCSLGEFLHSYRENKTELIQQTKDLRAATFNYELSFATCWTISITNLDKNPGDLLGILSLLDPELDEDIVKNFAEHEKAPLIPVLKDIFTYREAFRKIRRHTLIQQTPESKIISIHRLVQDAAIRTLETNGTLGTAFDNAVLCLSRVYPRRINGESMSNNFPVCQRLTPHVLTLEKNFKKYFHTQRMSTETGPRLKQQFVEILANCGWYLYERGDIRAAITLFSTAERICETLFNNAPHPLTALIYNNVCVIHNSQNRPLKSLDYAMKALNIREQCLAKDDPEMGNSYSNYAHNLFDLGKFEDAQVYYEKSLALHQASKIPSDDLLEGVFSSMANNLTQMGRLEEAEAAFKKAFSHHEGLGSENFFVGVTLFSYGSLKMMQQKWDEAEEAIRKCLSLRLSLLGVHHRLVGVTQHHLAFLCIRRGETIESISLLRSAVTIFRVPEQTQRGLAPRSMLKLASILLVDAEHNKDLEEMQEALALQQEAKSICKNDPLLAKLPTEAEEDWEKLAYIGYRCC